MILIFLALLSGVWISEIVGWIIGIHRFSISNCILLGITLLFLIAVTQSLVNINKFPTDTLSLALDSAIMFFVNITFDIARWRFGWGLHPRRPIWETHV